MKLSQAPRAPFRKRESVLCPDDLNSARANPRGGSPGSFLEGEALFPYLAKPYDVDLCTNKSGSRRIAKGKRFKHSLQCLFGVLSSEVRLPASSVGKLPALPATCCSIFDTLEACRLAKGRMPI